MLGGKTKEFQAEIDLDRMRAFNLTLPQIMTAIGASNSNVGGRTISLGEQSVNVRGLGVLTSVKDMENIVLTQQGGLPVLLSDVAKCQVGFRPRLGMAGRGTQTPRVVGSGIRFINCFIAPEGTLLPSTASLTPSGLHVTGIELRIGIYFTAVRVKWAS